MKYQDCKYCGSIINLQGDNIGLKINYYGTCNECGASFSADFDAKNPEKELNRIWTPPDNHIEEQE